MKVVGMEARGKRREYVMEHPISRISEEDDQVEWCNFIVHSESAENLGQAARNAGLVVGTIDPNIDIKSYSWGIIGKSVRVYLTDEQEDHYVGEVIGTLLREGAETVVIVAQEKPVPSR